MADLLQVSEISKSYSGQVILDEASFCVGERKKIAVIGRNGAGKSTLFRIIIGQEQSDNGQVVVSDRTTLGYLEQEDDFKENETVMTYLVRKSDAEEWECAKVASQFQLKEDKLDAKISSLSGGYQMRVKLTAMLLLKPNLILLDEPTNYLDLSTMLLLEKFLVNFKGSYLIISHDRQFIANTCTEVLEIEAGKTYHFPNTLENYFEFKEKKVATEISFNKKQEKKKKHLQSFVDRFGAKATKASQAQSKVKQIAKIETIAITKPLKSVRMRIQDTDEVHGFAWRLDDLTIGYPEKKVAEDIAVDIEKGLHVAVLGDNGQGKSTFLKTLAEQIEPMSGEFKKHPNMKVAYYSQHVTVGMQGQETVEQYLRNTANHNFTDEDIFKMAGNFLFRGDDLKKPISILSGGEKARLCLAGIFLNKYDVLLLDEPTSHLDFETVEVLASSLAETRVTIIFVSHDRSFINILANQILEVKDGTVKRFSGSFDDYVEYLENEGTENEQSKENLEIRESQQEKELRKLSHEENKKNKRALSRIERKISELKKEKNEILKTFVDNPTQINPEMNQRLKEIENEIQKHEEDWIAVSEKITE